LNTSRVQANKKRRSMSGVGGVLVGVTAIVELQR